MTHRHQTGLHDTWTPMAAEAFPDSASARRSARKVEAARRARIRYHARWIMINLVLIGAGAWLLVNVLIPRFITKELTTQAAALVHADYEGSAPDTRPASLRTPVASMPSSSSVRRASRAPRSAYADAAMLEELGAQCVDKRVFRKTVTKGVTEITEVIGLRC